MGGLFTSFNAGVSGLKVSQAGLNVTAHNISNTDTKGYVRQHAVITDLRYNNTIGYRNALNQVGLGTNIACVRQYRDAFLDSKYRLEVGRECFYEAQYNAVTEVEDLFGELEGEQFQSMIKNLWGTLQEFSMTPDSIVARDMFISAAQSFYEKCDVIQKQLTEYQESLNSEIIKEVNQINDIAKQISELNKKIVAYEASGQENANDLRDTRNLLLDRLGEHVKIKSTEMPNGSVVVYAEGAPLVTESVYYTMTTAKMSESSNLLKPVWKNNGCGDVFGTTDISYSTEKGTDIGSLRSIMTARGTDVANYTTLPIRPQKKDYTDENGNLDETAYKVALLDFENQTAVYNKTIAPSVIMTMQAQFDYLIHTVMTMFNDILCPNKEIEIQVTLPDGSLGTEKIRILDIENAPIASNEEGTMGMEIFSRKETPRYTEENVTLANGETVTVMRYNEEDPSKPYSLYSILEVEVNPAILQNPNLIPIMANPSSGFTGGFVQENIEKLIKSFDVEIATLDPNALTTYTINGFYNAMIVGLGTKGNIYLGIAENQAKLVHSVDNMRQSLYGVSTDEEMVELIKFQHAYNASSRYITVIDEMLEHLVTRL